MDSGVDSLMFLQTFNAPSPGLLTWNMWEVIQVIRKTNGKPQSKKWQILTYNGFVWRKAFGFLSSSVFHVIFPSASPSGRVLWDISCSAFFHHVVYFPSLVHVMDGIYRTRWDRAKCSSSIKWSPAYFYCLQPCSGLGLIPNRYLGWNEKVIRHLFGSHWTSLCFRRKTFLGFLDLIFKRQYIVLLFVQHKQIYMFYFHKSASA